jgi:phage-related tail fiber protein
MPYQINKYNGDRLVVLEDGVLDTTTSVGLVGKNFAGYGEIQNENFLWLLENFAGRYAPTKAIQGQLWYDSETQRIRVYDGVAWNIVGNTVVSASQPVDNAPGDGWLDTSSNQFYVYDGTQFRFVGPEAVTAFGVTRLVSTKIKDDTNNDRAVIKATLNDTVVAIIAERDFNISLSAPIAGFSSLKKGITLSTTSFLKGNVIGNASTASELETARNINGVSFDGTADITVKASTTNYLISGNYITGPDFDGSTTTTWGVDATSNNTYGKIVARDAIGNFSASTITADLTGNTTGTHYGNVSGNVTGNTSGTHTGPVVGNVTGNVTGNVIGSLNGVVGNTTPTSGTFTVVSLSDELRVNSTSGTEGQILKSRGAGQSPIWGSPIVDLATQVTNILSGANGGTGRSSLTANSLVVGNGSLPVQLIAPGQAGNVLQSDGGQWTSQPLGIVAQVCYFARSTAPDGWLPCDGRAVSRTAYPALYAAIGVTWGAGDGGSTFNIPDLRGEFIRGWDAGRGIDSGRTFASVQASDVGNHTHIFRDVYGGQDDGGTPIYDAITGNRLDNFVDDQYYGPDEDGDTNAVFFNNRTEAAGGTETRPRNVALLPCIKY